MTIYKVNNQEKNEKKDILEQKLLAAVVVCIFMLFLKDFYYPSSFCTRWLTKSLRFPAVGRHGLRF